MENTIRQYLHIDNVIFIGILSAGIVITYLCALALKTLRALVVEKKEGMLWLFDALYGPITFFIMVTAYSIGYSFLRIPILSAYAIEQSLGILLLFNAGWLILNFGKRLLLLFFKVVNKKIMTMYAAGCLIMVGVVMIVLYYQVCGALILGMVIASLFFLLVNRITEIVPALQSAETETIPRRLVMTHIYIATSETDEAVKRAIQAIKEAIKAVEGTENDPYASLAGFTHGAFDVLVRYSITKPEKLDQVKQEVNLAIIRKLRDINIKLSER